MQYKIGIRGWKQWIIQKNEQIERADKKAKIFNTDILKLTADELNYLLCQFVKEVRKPNGSEYAPDTIYYLCLSIQQYLSENSCMGNIFTDPAYQQFTDTLDEVAVKFSEVNESTREYSSKECRSSYYYVLLISSSSSPLLSCASARRPDRDNRIRSNSSRRGTFVGE